MFENFKKILKKLNKKEEKVASSSKNAAKERLHLVLMQDRANVSADFLELMKQEIIDVIKKYIDVDESAIDVRLTNKENADGTNGAPALYANIPIVNIKNDARKVEAETNKVDEKNEKIKEDNNNVEIIEKIDNHDEINDVNEKNTVSKIKEEELNKIKEDAINIIDDNVLDEDKKVDAPKNRIEDIKQTIMKMEETKTNDEIKSEN